MNKKLRNILVAIAILIVGVIVWMVFVYNPALNQSPASKKPTSAPIVNQVSPSSTITSPAPPRAPATYEYHVNAPNTLMLVDSQGRRTGKDPVTGIFYHEIPGTSYSEDGMSATNRIGDLIVQGISDGQYTLYVLGGKTGSYWVGMAGSSQTISGNIHLGSMAAYSLGYAKLITASSGVPSFQGISSSTASITTVPANNLPPPSSSK